MDQEIGFCTTADGISIAYATTGEGPPVVYVTGFPGHLSLEWESEIARGLIEELSQGVRLIRYDMRGSGLSDRDVPELTLERWVEDLRTVVDALGLDQFTLLSLGFLAGPIAITYAASHVDKVKNLILSSAFLLGSELSPPDRAKTMIDYITAYGLPAGMDMDMEAEEVVKLQSAVRLQRKSASTEVQGAVVRAMFEADVRGLADSISMPALVMHGQEDSVVRFALGRDLAARLPNARFVPFVASAASPWQHQEFLAREIRSFLGIDLGGGADAPAAGAPLTILFTDMESSTATTQRLGDEKAQALVRLHNSVVRDALAEHGGTEIKHTGDGIMASFTSGSSGLAAAVAIQRALADRSEAGDDHVHVRIGLNAGEPVAEDRDLFGTAVQLASRICDRAQPGEILVSNVVRELVAGKGFLFADRGEFEMRGFEDPVRIYEVGWR